MKKQLNFYETTAKIRNDLLGEFDTLSEKKKLNNLSDADLDYFLARDRKAALILKTLQQDLQKKTLILRYGDLDPLMIGEKR